MKLRYILPAAALAIAASSAAEAACYHNGVAYGPGARRCYGGWLEECTVASYWKAVGQCRKDSKAGMSEGEVRGKIAVDPKKMKDKKN